MFIKTRTCRLSLNNKLTRVHYLQRGGRGRRKMTLTSDKVAFSQSRSLLVQCLSNRAATGQRCTVGWKLRAPGIADTTYLLSEKQNQRVKNNYCYVCKSPLRWIDFSSVSSLSFQSVIIGTPSCAFPQLTTRKSSMMITPRLPGSWPCVVLASSTWRGLQQSKANWPDSVRGLAISGWHSTGKTLWHSSILPQSCSAKPLFNNWTPH